MPTKRVTRLVKHRLPYFRTVKMIGMRQRIYRVVIDHFTTDCHDAHTQIAGGDKGCQIDVGHIMPFLELLENVGVDELQLRVQFPGLEFLLASVLKHHKAPDQQDGIAEKP